MSFRDVSREPRRAAPSGSPPQTPEPSRDPYYRAMRLTRFAQMCLVFIIVCCGTVGLLILLGQMYG